MSIFYEADGSVVLRDDHEPTRHQTIAAGMAQREQEAIIVAFFAAGVDGPPPMASAEMTEHL